MAEEPDMTHEPPVAWHREAPATIVVVVLEPVGPADVPTVCERTRILLEETGATELVCDIRIFERPCAVLMDAMARLGLVARRLDCSMQLRNATPDMRALIDLAGLAEVLPQARIHRRPRKSF